LRHELARATTTSPDTLPSVGTDVVLVDPESPEESVDVPSSVVADPAPPSPPPSPPLRPLKRMMPMTAAAATAMTIAAIRIHRALREVAEVGLGAALKGWDV